MLALKISKRKILRVTHSESKLRVHRYANFLFTTPLGRIVFCKVVESELVMHKK